MPKPSTSVRLSEEARELLAEVASAMGVSQAAVMEIAIRDLAEKRHITRKPKSEWRESHERSSGD